jgi:hypothetical protein
MKPERRSPLLNVNLYALHKKSIKIAAVHKIFRDAHRGNLLTPE